MNILFTLDQIIDKWNLSIKKKLYIHIHVYIFLFVNFLVLKTLYQKNKTYSVKLILDI